MPDVARVIPVAAVARVIPVAAVAGLAAGEKRPSRKPTLGSRRASSHARGESGALSDDGSEKRLVWLFAPVQYRLVWLVILLAHTINGAHLTAVAKLYTFVARPDFSYYRDLVRSAIRGHFGAAGVAYGVLSAAHMYRWGNMVWYSVLGQRCVFASGQKTICRHVRRAVVRVDRSVRTSPHAPKSARWVNSAVQWSWRAWFTRRGLFGVESPYFEARFILHKALEVLPQTYQAYKSSLLIGRPWINDVVVAIIVANCWSTSGFHYWLRGEPAKLRVVALAIDVGFSFLLSVVIPWLIFLPYVQHYDPNILGFSYTFLYNDVWFVNMVMDNRQLFAGSVLDLVMKLLPHMGIHGSLQNIKALVGVVRPYRVPSPLRSRASVDGATGGSGTAEGGASRVSSTVQPDLPRRSRVSVFLSRNRRQESSLPESDVMERTKQEIAKQLGTKTMKVVHLLFVMWGLFVLAVHVKAQTVSTSAAGMADAKAMCKHNVRPWFVSKYACLVMNYRCSYKQEASVDTAVFQVLEPKSLAVLILSHCPMLTVPTDIKRFSNLLGFEIYNSTIASWTTDAAITSGSHPFITYTILVYDNMPVLPDGIRDDLPNALQDIEIVRCNLTALPDDLYERWHSLSVFYYEFCSATAFPPALAQLNIGELSVIGNSIQSMPALDASVVGFQTFAISQNPLQQLPDSLGDTSGLTFLYMEASGIEELPSWIDDVSERVFAKGSAFCDALAAQDDPYGDSALVTCTTTSDRPDGLYPLAMMQQNRPL